jgi:hypothetical protein
MPLGTPRSLALFVLLTVLSSAACGGVFKTEYEYEEELTLAIDGSATMHVNASVASLVALRGAELDASPRARPDREAVRTLFSGPGVRVSTPTFSRRHGRRFVHVRVDIPDVRQLPRLAPFAWSSYRIDRIGDAVVFRQVVGKPAGRDLRETGWTGDEVVAFRMHLPSKVLFENASSNVERGNILAWEQPLRERLSGTPIELRVDMAPESILHATLLLFGSTILAAAATFGIVVWWVVRRGRRATATASPVPGAPRLPSSTDRSPRTRRTIAQSTAPEAAPTDR